MKLYVDKGGRAPSPRRVRMYLAEKGIAVPTEELVIHEENRTDEFRKKNPVQTLPVLELDDGTCLAESVSICRYFEELHPEPSLFGREPLERAQIDMWMRRAEWYLYLPIDFSGPDFLGEEAGRRFHDFAYRGMRFLDRTLAETEFLAGPRFTMADVFAFGALDYGLELRDFELDPALANARRWYDAIRARPSAKA